MSGSQTPSAAAPITTGNDPSMEDILASIRRILSEDETPAASPAPAPALQSEDASSNVLVLDPAMMVAEAPEPVAQQESEPTPIPATEPEPPPAAAASLVAPEAAAAAASSLGSLMRALANDRALQVRSTGPTIEDIVREELRPMLKDWLDNHLPPLVERLVRAEIERVVGRATT